MSGNGKKRTPLVAERRYPAKTTAQKPTQKKKAAKPAARRKAAPRKTKPRGLIGWLLTPFRWFARMIWAFTWRVGLVTALIIGGFSFYFAAQMPAMADLIDGRTRGSVTMTDLKGEVFAWRGDQFGGMVTAQTVSPHLHNAVIATEDKRFYRHFGISPRGIASAVRINLRAGRGPLSGNGGSTITQQTAKLLCLGVPYDPDRWETETAYESDCRRGSLWRKAREAMFEHHDPEKGRDGEEENPQAGLKIPHWGRGRCYPVKRPASSDKVIATLISCDPIQPHVSVEICAVAAPHSLAQRAPSSEVRTACLSGARRRRSCVRFFPVRVADSLHDP